VVAAIALNVGFSVGVVGVLVIVCAVVAGGFEAVDVFSGEPQPANIMARTRVTARTVLCILPDRPRAT